MVKLNMGIGRVGRSTRVKNKKSEDLVKEVWKASPSHLCFRLRSHYPELPNRVTPIWTSFSSS